MAGPEALTKKQVSIRLKSLAPDCWFFCPMMGAFGFAGVPDFVGVYKGKFFAVETKAEGKHPTKLQELCMQAIVAAGGHVMVIRGAYFSDDFVQDPGWARFDKIFKHQDWSI